MKIDMKSDEMTITILLVGALTREWVKELLIYWHENVITTSQPSRRIDLTNITFIDDEGKALLALLYRDGAQLIANGLLTSAIVDEITSSR